MARARSDLRATIDGLRQNSATPATAGEKDENTCRSVDAGNMDIGRKEASSRHQLKEGNESTRNDFDNILGLERASLRRDDNSCTQQLLP